MPTIKDEKLREKQSNYWHPIKGAGERWKSSWENGTNPIKGALDLNLLSLVPGLNLLQAAYDATQTKENITNTYRSAKQGDYKATAFYGGSVLLDLLGAKKAGNDLQERARKSMYQKVTPFGYNNSIASDTKSKRKQIFEWATDVLSGRKIDTNKVPEWKVNLSNHNSEKIDFTTGLNSPALAEFRDQAYRKALRLSPRNESNNIYKLNADKKTYSYDEDVISSIRKKNNADPIPSKEKILSPDDKGNYGDRYTLNGGYVSILDTPNGIYMYDKWDLHPFSDYRTIWKWGTEHIPGLKNFNASKWLGMDQFILNHKVK